MNKYLNNSYGEFFASKYWKEIFLDKYQGETINIVTNGLLLKQNWEKVRGKYKIINLNISVDATTEDVYFLIRGGNFKTLCENLKYIGDRSANGEINHFTMSFVMQRDNLHQMKDFVYFARGFNVNGVAFQKMDNRNNYSLEEYTEIDVTNPQSPYHEQYLNIINDPLFSMGDVGFC
jgi:MoaA/NifB/PqqE/SkfB family radical SAM enzyme